jgi:hypothetical protein
MRVIEQVHHGAGHGPPLQLGANEDPASARSGDWAPAVVVD